MKKFFKHFCAVACSAALAVSGLVCVPPEISAEGENYLLSDNKLSDDDKTTSYPGLKELKTGAAYSWLTKECDDANLPDNDSKCEKLQNGNLKGQSNDDAMIGEWRKATFATAVFDLKSSYIINRVDVWSLCGKPGGYIKKMANFTVSVSADGINYTELSTITNTTPSTEYPGGEMVNTSGDFSAQNAKGRYVKVRMNNNKDASWQNVLGEVLIFGQEDPDSSVAEVNTSQLELLLTTVHDYSSTHYTPVSYQTFSDAVSKAEAALTKKESQEEVNTAVSDLEKAIAGLEPSFEQFVLSENKFTSTDQDIYLYPKTKLDTGATYSWITYEPYDAAFSASDPQNSKMTGGTVAGTSGSDLVFGTWQSYKSGAVVFDLKKVYDVSQVDVWSNYYPGYGKMLDFSAAFSTDGETFSEPITFTNHRNTAGYLETGKISVGVKTVGQFEPQKARYVKIVMNPAAGSKQFNLGEIVIYGADNTADKTELNRLIAKGEDCKAYLYTPDSFAVLTAQLEQAKNVAHNDEASKDEVNAACTALSSAISGLVANVKTGILSDNSFASNVDNQQYGSVDIITTGVTYSYGEGTDADIIKIDSKNDKLKNGNVAGTEGKDVTNSKWENSPSKADIIYKFNKLYYINRVDVWSKYVISSRQAVDEFTVSVSINGVDWTEVAKATNESNVAENNNIMVVTKAEFPLSRAKFVKVSIPKGKGAVMFTLGEIVLFGTDAVGEYVKDFDFTELKFTDADGAQLTELNGVTDINIDAVVKNDSAAAKDVTVITGLYNAEGLLVAMDFNTQNIEVGGAGSTYHLKLGGLSGVTEQYRLRVFAWDSLEQCIPLTVVQEFGK